MKYAYQLKQRAKTAERDRNIVKYHKEHRDSSLEDIGRVFHLTGGRVSQILIRASKEKEHQAEVMARALKLAEENQNANDSLNHD